MDKIVAMIRSHRLGPRSLSKLMAVVNIALGGEPMREMLEAADKYTVQKMFDRIVAGDVARLVVD